MKPRARTRFPHWIEFAILVCFLAAATAWWFSLRHHYLAWELVSTKALCVKNSYMRPSPKERSRMLAVLGENVSPNAMVIDRLRHDTTDGARVVRALLSRDREDYRLGAWALIAAGVGSLEEETPDLRADLEDQRAPVRKAAFYALTWRAASLGHAARYGYASLVLLDPDLGLRARAILLWVGSHRGLLRELRGADLVAHQRDYEEAQARLLRTCLSDQRIVSALMVFPELRGTGSPGFAIPLLDHPNPEIADMAFSAIQERMLLNDIVDADTQFESKKQQREDVRKAIPRLEDFLRARGERVPADFGVAAIGSASATKTH